MLDHMIFYNVWEHIYPCSRSRGSAAPAAPPPLLRVRDDAQSQWRIRVNRSQWGLGLIETWVDVYIVDKIRIKWGLKPTIHVLHRRPCGGVILMSHPENKLLPDHAHMLTTRHHCQSFRSGNKTDYCVQCIWHILRELSRVYQTQLIILGGN